MRYFAITTLFLMLARVACAQITLPTTQPVDSSSPMSLMHSYDELAGQDPAAYRALYLLNDDDDIQRLAKVQAKFDAQVGMLQKIVQVKWGQDAVDRMLHALGLKSARDIDSADVKVMRHQAKVLYSDGTPGPDLIRTPAGWRVNIPAFRDALGISVDDYLKQLYQLSNILPEVADGIASEKLKDPDAVVSDIVQRINASGGGPSGTNAPAH